MTPTNQPVMTMEETKEGLLAIKEMMDAEQLRSHKDHGENMAEFKQISAPISAALHHLEAGKQEWISQPTGPGLWWHCAFGSVTLEKVYQRDAWSPHGLCIDDAERSWEDSLCATLPGVWMGPIIKPDAPQPSQQEGQGIILGSMADIQAVEDAWTEKVLRREDQDDIP